MSIRLAEPVMRNFRRLPGRRDRDRGLRLHLLGDALRDHWDPKLSGAARARYGSGPGR